MAFLDRFNIFAAFRDLALFLRTRQRHDYIAAVIAIAVTAFIVYAFNHDSRVDVGPQIVYVNNWPTTRTDSEIKAEQKIDQTEKDKAIAARRAQYRKLADQLGIDYKK